VRSLKASDARSIAAHANNRNIWINLRDRFPHPYRLRDAQAFIRAARRQRPETTFAIALDGQAIGTIGFSPQPDVERVSAEIGYWLAEPFWGRGIATDVVVAVTRYAIEHHHLTRVFGRCFAWNAASCRVFEKAGYAFEGRLRRAAVKGGGIIDELQYAFVPPE
jgi:[ribosomal protein S5]-alanine N-acetyltransferase